MSIQNKFTTDSLIAFLETKDPKEGYDVCTSSRCMLAQWAMSIDPKAVRPDRDDPARYKHSFCYYVGDELVDLHAFSGVAFGEESFGAALDRAKGLKANEALLG